MSAAEDRPSDGVDPTTLAASGSSGHVVFDLPCVRCQYNLRTLERSGRCPECGEPVELSLRAYHYAFADPVWIRKLEFGGRLIIGALLCFVLAAFIITILAVWQPFRFAGAAWPIQGLLLLLLTAGAWLVTSPNPRATRTETWHAVRRATRAGLLLCLSGAALWAYLWGFPAWRLAAFCVLMSLSPLGVAGMFTMCALGLHCARLARTMGETKFERRARVLTGAFACFWIVTAVLILIGAGKAIPGGPWMVVAYAANLLGLPGVLALGLMIFTLPAQLVAPFRKCRATAEAARTAALQRATSAEHSSG